MQDDPLTPVLGERRGLPGLEIGQEEVRERLIHFDLAQAGSERLAYPEPYHGEVAGLVAGSLAGRANPAQRNALVFAGLGLADVAVAAAVYERAKEKGVGRVLPV